MSSLGLTTTVMATWEAYSVTFQTVLNNGGPVRLSGLGHRGIPFVLMQWRLSGVPCIRLLLRLRRYDVYLRITGRIRFDEPDFRGTVQMGG